MSILIFIIVLAILILSHELGHFLAAKKSGIRVDEFCIGFPPRIFKFKKGETLYSIGVIPFGGFVKIHGEDGEAGRRTSDGRATSEIDPRSFASKPARVKAMVISAGVIFNILLAWFLITLGYTIGLPASMSAAPEGAQAQEPRVVIVQVQEGTAAQSAGLQIGDHLLDFQDAKQAQDFINENRGKEINIRYKRGDEIYSVPAIPSVNPENGKGALGIAMDEVGILKLPLHQSIWEGLKTTCQVTIAVAEAIFYFFYDVFRGMAGLEEVSGPVGIASAAGAVAKLGFSYLLSFMALLSINLAVLNIIPFPALDGGRLLFLLIEKIKGSPINSKFSSIAHAAGLAILLVLMLAITYHDILRLI